MTSSRGSAEPYEIRLSPHAVARLDSFEKTEAEFVANRLLDLAESPARLSRPSTPPAELPGYQVFGFESALPGPRVFFKVFFRYEADERTPYVYTVGRVQYAPEH